MSFYEMDETMDISKSIIEEMETSIESIKYIVTNELNKEAMEAECVHREDIQR